MGRFAAAVLLFLSMTVPGAAQDATAQIAQVTVDPRIELMGAIQLHTDYPLVTNHSSPYKNNVRAYFREFDDHSVVRLFGKMDGERFSFNAVPKTTLSLIDPPERAHRVPYPERVVSAAGASF